MKLAVAAVKGMPGRFVVIEAEDPGTVHGMKTSREMSEDDLHAELEARGYTAEQISALIEAAKRNPA
jgi:hypothetical protein